MVGVMELCVLVVVFGWRDRNLLTLAFLFNFIVVQRYNFNLVIYIFASHCLLQKVSQGEEDS